VTRAEVFDQERPAARRRWRWGRRATFGNRQRPPLSASTVSVAELDQPDAAFDIDALADLA
jgi:hypothetical protein